MAVGLRGLSVLMGVFLILMGFGKTSWLVDDGILLAQLERWLELAPPLSLWYLETVAIPGAPLFARLVPLGELAMGAALVLGYRIQLAAAVALLMIINFHFASGIVFTYGYLTNGYGLPVLGGLFALAAGGTGLPFGVSLSRRT
jgi:uncharacterized membrane protein YphA (DoxX/SURF4 family)